MTKPFVNRNASPLFPTKKWIIINNVNKKNNNIYRQLIRVKRNSIRQMRSSCRWYKMFNSTSLPTEKIELDWYGSGPLGEWSWRIDKLKFSWVYTVLYKIKFSADQIYYIFLRSIQRLQICKIPKGLIATLKPSAENPKWYLLHHENCNPYKDHARIP